MAGEIWERCGGAVNVRRISGKAWRVVEGQHVISTRKLVDSREEQEILESLIEESKPPLADAPEFEGLHYLLSTPFRYPPLRHGSRFGTRNEPALWYGSTHLRTALAETAYYRLLFLEGTTADLEPLILDLTAFRAPYRTSHGVDLCRVPFDAHRATLAVPDRYDRTQRLGAAMRAAGVEAFRYPSAREAAGGVHVALFTPRAFASKLPQDPENWSAVLAREAVEFVKKDFIERRVLRFPREQFEIDGRFPAPAVFGAKRPSRPRSGAAPDTPDPGPARERCL